MKRKMLNNRLHIYIILLACTTLLLSCSHSDDGFALEEPAETMTLLIAAPQGSGTRAVGDPGEAVNEGEDWDELAVIIAYTELEDGQGSGNLPVVVKILTKDDFERLPVYTGTTYRQLRLYVQKGKVHIYGVTYSHGADADLDNSIPACSNSSEASVHALAISNGYASGDARQTEKFLSVATGYYQDDSGKLAEYEISKEAENGELKPIPSMRLTRLAAKIDIQWDAQDAYTQGYTDVGVEGFEYAGGATFDTGASDMEKKGKGRLFPDLYTGTEVLNGSSTVLNQIPISKRNGRVYHYVFPDGASQPKVTFTLSGTKNGNTVQNNYTFQFPDKIQKSTWYKVNTTIRGVTGTTTITQNN